MNCKTVGNLTRLCGIDFQTVEEVNKIEVERNTNVIAFSTIRLSREDNIKNKYARGRSGAFTVMHNIRNKYTMIV